MVTRPPDWTRHAACLGMADRGCDPWHPGRADAGAYSQAKQLCLRCPVRAECLDYALDLMERLGRVAGMFAGLTPRELRALARERGRPTRAVAQHGTRARYVNYQCRCDPCRRANATGEAERRLGLPA